MRRVAVLLGALFLVNLPFVNQALIDRDVARNGQEVPAEILGARRLGGSHFLDYRLPESVDPQRGRFSARVDARTFAAAKQAGSVQVRVVPGEPARNRAAGQVDGRLFASVAILSDVFLAFGLVVYWRRRRWRVYEVLDVGEHLVVLRHDGRTVTATAPERWLLRARAGRRVAGSLHLLADADVLPRDGETGLEQVTEAAYVVRGRVLDARAGRVRLEAGARMTLSVATGPHRIRVDMRDLAQATGTLCFTPS